jgi:hypothetical protein
VQKNPGSPQRSSCYASAPASHGLEINIKTQHDHVWAMAHVQHYRLTSIAHAVVGCKDKCRPIVAKIRFYLVADPGDALVYKADIVEVLRADGQ